MAERTRDMEIEIIRVWLEHGSPFYPETGAIIPPSDFPAPPTGGKPVPVLSQEEIAQLPHEKAKRHFEDRWRNSRANIMSLPTSEQIRLAADLFDARMFKAARNLLKHVLREAFPDG